MSITAECTACGRRYEAPASMAGKRVRCKQCGNIFALPDASFEEEPDLNALEDVERSFHSVDATDAGGSGVREGEDEDDSGESVAPLRMGRTNVRFRFPLAGELDVWLPRVLLPLSLLWLGWICFKRDETGIAWMPYVRLGVALVAFFLFIGPITHMMIRKAGRQLGYQMPVGDKFRAFAAYLPAFAMGYAMWVASGGTTMGLVMGCFAGVILATAALWFFFRLGPSEIAPSATYALVGFFLGLGIAAAIFAGINFVLLEITKSTKWPAVLALPASPIGPQPTVQWLSLDQREELLAAREKEAAPPPRPGPTSPIPDTGTAPSPSPEPALSPIVQAMQSSPFVGFDELLRPLTDSMHRATVRNVNGQLAVQVWNIDTWRQRGSTSFAPGTTPWENRYMLSADGNLLGRIAQFPGLEVQITNLAEQRVTHRLPLERRDGTPELVGFIDAAKFLIRWQSGPRAVFEVRDIAAPASIRLINDIPPFDTNGSSLVLGRGGRLIAVATKVQPPPSTQPADATAAAGPVPSLLVFSTETGQKVSEVRIDSLASLWPVTPTGMDLSVDGTLAALLFEQAGNALLVWYQIDQAQGRKVNEIVNPSGLVAGRAGLGFQGSSLQWLPDNKSLLMYGQMVFSTTAGRRVEEIGVTGIERAWVSRPNWAEIVNRGADGQRQLQLFRLDLDRIGTLAGGR